MAYDTDERDSGIAADETADLISSEKVDGTAVYNRQEERLGTIRNFMVGKRDGTVQYAVLRYGGLFGLGDRFYPLPWDVLTYDTEQGGYVVDLDKEKLKNAPSYEADNEPTYDRAYGQSINDYYGVSY
jgi:hypothetical protein